MRSLFRPPSHQSHSISAPKRGRGIAPDRAAATLDSDRCKSIEHLDPTAPYGIGQFRPRLMGQVEFAPASEWHQLHDHSLELQGVFFLKESEYEAARRYDLEVLADMVDILAILPFHDVEPTTRSRVDLHAFALFPPRNEQPLARRARIKPGIEDALRR